MKWYRLAILGWLVCSRIFAQATGPGSALALDGSGGYVAIATTGSLTGTFTVELWANPNSTNGMELVDSRFLPREFGFDLQLWNGDLIHGDIGNGSTWWKVIFEAYFPYNPGDWHHFAVVVNPPTTASTPTALWLALADRGCLRATLFCMTRIISWGLVGPRGQMDSGMASSTKFGFGIPPGAPTKFKPTCTPASRARNWD